MAATDTSPFTLRDAVNTSKAGQVEDALKLMQLGNMLIPMKYTVTLTTPSATVNITNVGTPDQPATVTASSVSPILTDPTDINRLPAALNPTLTYVNVTTGTATGVRTIIDAGGTPAVSATLASLNDAGTIITFEATVTTFIIWYVPRSAVNMLSLFQTT